MLLAVGGKLSIAARPTVDFPIVSAEELIAFLGGHHLEEKPDTLTRYAGT